MSQRRKSRSGWLADGKPTSISLKPIFTSVDQRRLFCSIPIGSNRAWLPSRGSTLAQRGALVKTRFGHWRSVNGTAAVGLYLVWSNLLMGLSLIKGLPVLLCVVRDKDGRRPVLVGLVLSGPSLGLERRFGLG